MATLYVMQAGRTEWSQQNRIDSIAGAPLTEDGAAAAREIAAELRGRGITALYRLAE